MCSGGHAPLKASRLPRVWKWDSLGERATSAVQTPSRLAGNETSLKGWSVLAVPAGPFLGLSALQNQ